MIVNTKQKGCKNDSIAADDAVTRNKCTSNFALLGCNVLTHVKERVIHFVVNVVSVSCQCKESNNIKMC